MIRNIAVLMPADVDCGLNATDKLIAAPGPSEVGSDGRFMISNCDASVPMIDSPPAGIWITPDPLLEIVTRLVGEAAPPNPNDEVMAVSVNSPMGEALMKAHVGDTVKVKAPRGTMEFKILEIVQ